VSSALAAEDSVAPATGNGITSPMTELCESSESASSEEAHRFPPFPLPPFPPFLPLRSLVRQSCSPWFLKPQNLQMWFCWQLVSEQPVAALKAAQAPAIFFFWAFESLKG